jgi:iduronate 2-sulfatase
VKGGQTTRSLAEFVDLYPTVADFCGLKVPHAVAGVSLRPVLAKPDASVKAAAFTLVTRGPKLHGQSIRTDRWRFTQWSDGAQELYDHNTDPEENHDVAKANPAVVEKLAAHLKTLPPYRLTP